MGDHLHVGPDHMQVDAVLLLPDDDSPPQTAIGRAAVFPGAVSKQVCASTRHVFGGGHWGVICQRMGVGGVGEV